MHPAAMNDFLLPCSLAAGSAPPDGPPGLLTQLGMVFALAAVVSVLGQKLRIPAMIGYVVAGLCIAPWVAVPGNDSVQYAIRELAEIGVLLLMFSVGLEFDIKGLGRRLWPCLGALVLQTVLMFSIGHQAGQLLGWGGMGGLFLGGVLSVSSTVATMRLLSDSGRLRQPHGQLAFGVLVLEDVLAVLLLAILGGVGVGRDMPVSMAAQSVLFMGVFSVAVFFFGKMLVPRAVRFIHGLGRAELLTLSAIGFLMAIGMLARQVSFPAELGAFLAGATLAHTSWAQRVQDSLAPVRDLFGAIFFVSVGLAVPAGILDDLGWIALLALVVALGKTAACWAGFWVAGEAPSDAFRASTAKANVGEFGFVLASMGRASGVVDDRLFGIAVGVCVVTLALGAIESRVSDPLYRGLAWLVPVRVRGTGGAYQSWLAELRARLGRIPVFRLLRRPAIGVASYLLILQAIVVGLWFLAGWVERADLPVSDGATRATFVWMGGALLMLPFAVAILRHLGVAVQLLVEAACASRGGSPFREQGSFRNLLSWGLFILFVAVGLQVFLAASSRHLPRGAPALLLALSLVGLGALLWRRMIRVNSRMENLFMDGMGRGHDANPVDRLRRGTPADIVLREVEIAPGTLSCGRRLRELGLRRLTGCNLVAIVRQGYHFWSPGPENGLFPGDTIVIAGTEAQNAACAALLATPAPDVDPHREMPQVESVVVLPGSDWDGRSIADLRLRSGYGVTIVSLERNGTTVSPITPELLVAAGDRMVLIGPAGGIASLLSPVG